MADGKFILSRKAIADLEEIWNCTAEQWSEQQAGRYYELLVQACRDAARLPASNPTYEVILPGLHGMHVGKHIIFYRTTTGSAIEVVRILHQRMDLPNRLKE